MLLKQLMVTFKTTIQKFGSQGEKTGWNHILIPAAIAQKLKPNNKKSFRVEGKLDETTIEKVALLPMGGGNFIMPLNTTLRKKIHKRKGDVLQVQLEEDKRTLEISAEFMECLHDEPQALKHFMKLPPSHRSYYSKWIESAKTEQTKAKRIALAVNALSKGGDFGEMIRMEKQNRKTL